MSTVTTPLSNALKILQNVNRKSDPFNPEFQTPVQSGNNSNKSSAGNNNTSGKNNGSGATNTLISETGFTEHTLLENENPDSVTDSSKQTPQDASSSEKAEKEFVLWGAVTASTVNQTLNPEMINKASDKSFPKENDKEKNIENSPERSLFWD